MRAPLYKADRIYRI